MIRVHTSTTTVGNTRPHEVQKQWFCHSQVPKNSRPRPTTPHRTGTTSHFVSVPLEAIPGAVAVAAAVAVAVAAAAVAAAVAAAGEAAVT